MAVATATREKPILFSTALVPSVMSGAKTQTRRVINLSKVKHRVDWVGWTTGDTGDGWHAQSVSPACCDLPAEINDETSIRLPYQVGDVLYVRETVRFNNEHANAYYAADSRGVGEKVYSRLCEIRNGRSFIPSMHLPKWAARTWLEVVGVKVERLQDISEEDAIAEGVEKRFLISVAVGGKGKDEQMPNSYRCGFRLLWDSISKPGSQWADNPYVSVTEFRKVER